MHATHVNPFVYLFRFPSRDDRCPRNIHSSLEHPRGAGARIIIFILQVRYLGRARLNDLARSLSKSVMKLEIKLQTLDFSFSF